VDPSWTSVPYGKPMRNQRFDVLDAALRPRPIGVAGDLYIAGDGLARGYFRDEEKTRTSFLERASTGERLYKTGDLGRYLPDGNIEFLGREDFQVKISGHRVELGEVEVALGQEQGIKAVVASAIGPRGAKRLIAYVVPEPGRALSEAELSRALARKLPAYAVPSRILTLDSLPLTSNGKVDRRLLPDPGAVPQATEHSPPRSETERVLAELWQTLLATSDFGVRDNFFAMGGQSLLAVRLMTQLKQRCGVALPLSALFEHPTIEALAKLVDQGQAKSRRAALVTVRAQGRETPWFFVHPVGGDVLCYAELSAAFGENQPFFALQTPELPAEAAAPTSIEGMAALYEAALREVRPNGPYRVGGWSMGGVVAYELGQRLRRSGEAVESLVLVDVTMAPVGARAEVDDAWFLAAFARDLGGLAQTDLRFEARELRELDEPARWARVLAGVRAGRLMAEEPDAASLQLYFKRFRANYRAMLDYQALPYHGALLFLRATEHGATRAVAQDWCALSTSAELVDVAGDHYAITRSATARAIVEQIQASSRSVKSASRAGPRSAGSSPMNQQITPNDGE
jgi:thioesterase domain-containing protein/aryl carrier-like protein